MKDSERNEEVRETQRMWDEKIKAAIFDADGTLLDSMPVWNDIGELYLKSIGLTAREGLGETLHTMSLEQGADYLKKEYRLEKQIPEIVGDVLKIVADFLQTGGTFKTRSKRNSGMAETQAGENGCGNFRKPGADRSCLGEEWSSWIFWKNLYLYGNRRRER